MSTQDDLVFAKRALVDAQERVRKLEEQAAFESSFGDMSKVYAVTRRDVGTGRLMSVLAVFPSHAEAVRFRNGQYAWREAGFDVQPLDFYPGKV